MTALFGSVTIPLKLAVADCWALAVIFRRETRSNKRAAAVVTVFLICAGELLI
jgi:hypothetical protein